MSFSYAALQGPEADASSTGVVLPSRALSIVSLLVLAASLAACGGTDIGDDAFQEGDSTGTTTGTPATSTSAATGSTAQASGASTGSGDGGAGPGGGASSDGGGGASSADGGGGSSSTDGGGGAGPATCDDGCAPLGDAEGDCDGDSDPNGDDCQPCDAQVHHDQEGLFGEPYASFADGAASFDYDCDGAAEPEYPHEADGCSAFDAAECPDEDSIYTGDQPPTCGEVQSVQDCRVTGQVVGVGGSCTEDGASSQVIVRCR